MRRLPVRRRIRLAPAAYASVGAVCSITIGLGDRAPYFADPRLTAAAVDVLRTHSSDTGVPIIGYCFMPDHVHLLLAPSSDCDLVTFVGQFKNLVQRVFWDLGGRGTIWQKSFWDHFLRAEEDIAVVLDYILNNPVRARLVATWSDYPFSGSFTVPVRSGGGQAPALRTGDRPTAPDCGSAISIDSDLLRNAK